MLKSQDLSTNGVILNGHKIRKTSVILMDGDTVEIPSSQSLSPYLNKPCLLTALYHEAFECIHIWKEPNEKSNIFDPTPPQKPSIKVAEISTPSTWLKLNPTFASVLAIIWCRHTVLEVVALLPFILLWIPQRIGKLPARVSNPRRKVRLRKS